MGGKSRKTGGVSKALINRIKAGGRRGSSKKSKEKGKKDQPKGLLDSPEE